MEKRDSLNVIPMVVGDQNVGVDAAIAMKLREAIAQHAQAGAAIQNEMSAVRARSFRGKACFRRSARCRARVWASSRAPPRKRVWQRCWVMAGRIGRRLVSTAPKVMSKKLEQFYGRRGGGGEVNWFRAAGSLRWYGEAFGDRTLDLDRERWSASLNRGCALANCE